MKRDLYIHKKKTDSLYLRHDDTLQDLVLELRTQRVALRGLLLARRATRRELPLHLCAHICALLRHRIKIKKVKRHVPKAINRVKRHVPKRNVEYVFLFLDICRLLRHRTPISGGSIWAHLHTPAPPEVSLVCLFVCVYVSFDTHIKHLQTPAPLHTTLACGARHITCLLLCLYVSFDAHMKRTL